LRQTDAPIESGTSDDERYHYLINNGQVILQEDHWQFLLVALPQIKGSTIFYRSNQLRKTNPLTINLSSKNLQNVPLFEGEDAATSLYLSNNQIYNIENLVSLPSLTFIDFSNNLIHEVGGFENLCKIETLLLGHNFIKSIRSFDNICLSLRKLDLSNNQLKSMQWLNSLPNLQILDLSSNLLTNIDVEHSHSALETLNLSKNPLIGVEKLVLFESLKLLNLEEIERIFEIEQIVSQIGNVNVVLSSHQKVQREGRPPSSVILASDFKADEHKGFHPDLGVNLQAFRTDPMKGQEAKDSVKKPVKKTQDRFSKDKPGMLITTKEVSEVFAELVGEINRKEFGRPRKVKSMHLLTPASTGLVEQVSAHHVKVIGNGCFQFFQNALTKYAMAEEITFDCALINNIILKENMIKLLKMKRLTSLNLINNNITSYLELIHLENLPHLQKLQISNNPIIKCELLKYFIYYRYSKIKSFNNSIKKEKDLSYTKSLYIKFDKALQKPSKVHSKKSSELQLNKNQLAKGVAKAFLDNLMDDLQTDKMVDGCLEQITLDMMLREVGATTSSV